MGLWAKSVVIFNAIREHGKQSIRSLADRTGLSKSSVHRHLQAMDRRDRSPESSLWETPAGRAWLIRLVVATLFVFGFKRGVGAETLSEFFSRLRLEGHVGCSPSALRSVLHTLERLLLDTAVAWEQEGIAHGEIRPVIGAVDETFLQRMMLVFMDLATGYVLMEEVAADRSYATWCDRANARLTTFGTEMLSLVSDRAKALIKLAHTGLRCPSIPDVFHLGHDLAKSYALAIFGRLRQAKRELEHAKQGLGKLQKNIQTDSAQVAQAQARVAAWATSVNHWQEVGRAWRQHLSNVSGILHPWQLVDSIRQTSKEVEEQLRAEIKAIETLLETNGLPRKQATLDKVQKQLAGISALVDLWWHNCAARATRCKKPRLRACSRRLQRCLSGIHAPDSLNLSCWRVGKRGRQSMPRRSSGPRRRLRDATATSRRCSTTIAACLYVATRCGQRYITSIVGL